jgi:predicted alpha/beta superfamily hydrolase
MPQQSDKPSSQVRSRQTLRGLLVSGFADRFLNFDKGLIHTVVRLTTNPDRVIREYLDGQTASYTHPVGYVLITFAAFALVGRLFGGITGATDSSNGAFTALLIPVVACVSWLVFRRAALRYAEHLIIDLYLFGQIILLWSLLLALSAITGSQSAIGRVIFAIGIIVSVSYFVWAHVRIFPRRKGFTAAGALVALLAGTVLWLGGLIVILRAYRAQSPQETAVATPITIGETFTIDSKALGEVRRINVYVPALDSAALRAGLPVMYMPDGGMAEDFLHIAGLVQVSVGNGTMRPFLLVGIENTERRRDLTGPTKVAEDSTIAPHVGGSAAFRRFIRTELMPVINTRYHTTAETAIMGESLAGLFVVETFFVEPDLFNTYIAFDPSLWWNNHELVDHATQRLHAGGLDDRRLYLASSSEAELAQLTGRLAEVLRTDAPAGLKWQYQPMPDETHATIYHPAAILAVRRLFKPAETGEEGS